LKSTSDVDPSSAANHSLATKAANIVDALARSQAIIEFDLDCKVVRANENFLALMGYRLEEIVGQPHKMFCLASAVENPNYAAFWADLLRGTCRSGEFLRVGKNGREVYIQASYNPVLDDAGNVVGIVKFASDITAAKTKSLEDESKVAAISRSQGTIEFDLAGIILGANENFLRLMDYSAAEVVGQHHRMFVEPKEAETPRYRSFWQKLANGEYESGEFLRLGRDGKRVWIQATYNPILDLDGRPVKVVKFCSDITPAKLAAIESAARMAAVSVSNAVLEIGADRKILAVNPVMECALGMTAKALIGLEESAIMFDEDARGVEHVGRWAIFADGKPVTADIRRKGIEGRAVWLAASFSPILGLDGNLSKVVVMAKDVTAEMLARLDANGKLAAIDRAQAVIEFDMSGNVLTANENFLKLMNYRLSDVVGRHHRMFTDPVFASTPEY